MVDSSVLVWVVGSKVLVVSGVGSEVLVVDRSLVVEPSVEVDSSVVCVVDSRVLVVGSRVLVVSSVVDSSVVVTTSKIDKHECLILEKHFSS